MVASTTRTTSARPGSPALKRSGRRGTGQPPPGAQLDRPGRDTFAAGAAGRWCLPGLACYEPQAHRQRDDVVTSRWDHRVLRRSVIASRGHAGAIVPESPRWPTAGMVWPVLGGVLCLRRSTRRAGGGVVGAMLVCSAVTRLHPGPLRGCLSVPGFGRGRRAVGADRTCGGRGPGRRACQGR